jgi:hypothetical protein
MVKAVRLIKLTVEITPEVYEAVVDEAARLGIRVVGHVDPRVGVARALAARQQIEHLDNYMESVLVDSAAGRPSVSDVGAYRRQNWETLDLVDDRKVEGLAGATARAGRRHAHARVLPTLVRDRAHGRGSAEPSGLRPHSREDARRVRAGPRAILAEPSLRSAPYPVHRGPESHGEGNRRLRRPDHGRLRRAGGPDGIWLVAAP